MKKLITLTVFLIVCLSGSLLLNAQIVEEWEKRINDRQPIQKVIETIGLKPGMVIGEVGAVPEGSLSGLPNRSVQKVLFLLTILTNRH